MVRLPRLTREACYSGQFVTRYLALGILWRRVSLNLYGMDLTRMDGLRPYRPSVTPCHRLQLQPTALMAQPMDGHVRFQGFRTPNPSRLFLFRLPTLMQACA